MFVSTAYKAIAPLFCTILVQGGAMLLWFLCTYVAYMLMQLRQY